jgi:hypothetical protein
VATTSGPGAASYAPGATASGPASAAPASSATSSAPAPLWSGDVSIPDITGGDLEFNRVPPRPAQPGDLETGIWAGQVHDDSVTLNNGLSGHNLLGVLPAGASPPNGVQCSDWATTHPEKTVIVSAGTLMCLKTEDGHTALLTIKPLSPSGGGIDASVVLWAPSS